MRRCLVVSRARRCKKKLYKCVGMTEVKGSAECSQRKETVPKPTQGQSKGVCAGV